MSFECDTCHTVATGKSGANVHYAPVSYGPCESCRRTSDTYDCSCFGDWPAARIAAGQKE